MHSLFLSCLMQGGEQFLLWPEKVYQTKYRRFVWHGTVGKCVPKFILTTKVRTRCQACSTVNRPSPCEKDIPAFRQSEDNWRSDAASRLQRDVTCVGRCTVTATLCVCERSRTVLNCNHKLIFQYGLRYFPSTAYTHTFFIKYDLRFSRRWVWRALTRKLKTRIPIKLVTRICTSDIQSSCIWSDFVSFSPSKRETKEWTCFETLQGKLLLGNPF
jgi:hypothetical protein